MPRMRTSSEGWPSSSYMVAEARSVGEATYMVCSFKGSGSGSGVSLCRKCRATAPPTASTIKASSTAVTGDLFFLLRRSVPVAVVGIV